MWTAIYQEDTNRKKNPRSWKTNWQTPPIKKRIFPTRQQSGQYDNTTTGTPSLSFLIQKNPTFQISTAHHFYHTFNKVTKPPQFYQHNPDKELRKQRSWKTTRTHLYAPGKKSHLSQRLQQQRTTSTAQQNHHYCIGCSINKTPQRTR